jgi:hypothetical protein
MMHDKTRAYLRADLEDKLVKAMDAARAATAPAEISRALQLVRELSTYLEDLLTFQMDVKEVAVPPTREQNLAMKLFLKVVDNADTVRALETKLSTGKGAGTDMHKLVANVVQFIDYAKRPEPGARSPLDKVLNGAVDHVNNLQRTGEEIAAQLGGK